MQIGIITFHRAHNYGAVLQCYALQEVLKGMGHEVEVIDYRQRWVEAQYRAFDPLYIRKKLISPKLLIGFLLFFLKRLHKTRQRRSVFNEFLKSHLCISKNVVIGTHIPKYDYYVIGSDQLWSKDCCGGNFDDIYFGIFSNNNNNTVGYAISTTKKCILEICNDKPDVFKNFKSISFRENFAVECTNNVLDSIAIQTIDPTLLLKSEDWEKIISHNYSQRNIVALFQVRNPQGKDVLRNKAELLSEKMGCELIDLSDIKHNVEEFLSIIKYAKCVITSSFHATVFSLVFGTPFYTYKLEDGRDDRYIDLLNDLGASRHLKPLTFTPQEPLPVNTDIVQESLGELRKQSLKFLKDSFIS